MLIPVINSCRMTVTETSTLVGKILRHNTEFLIISTIISSVIYLNGSLLWNTRKRYFNTRFCRSDSRTLFLLEKVFSLIPISISFCLRGSNDKSINIVINLKPLLDYIGFTWLIYLSKILAVQDWICPTVVNLRPREVVPNNDIIFIMNIIYPSIAKFWLDFSTHNWNLL